jgi:hypothetical protein
MDSNRRYPAIALWRFVTTGETLEGVIGLAAMFADSFYGSCLGLP